MQRFRTFILLLAIIIVPAVVGIAALQEQPVPEEEVEVYDADFTYTGQYHIFIVRGRSAHNLYEKHKKTMFVNYEERIIYILILDKEA